MTAEPLVETPAVSPLRRMARLGPLRLLHPHGAEVDAALASMADAQPTYPHVGASLGELPDGWRHDDQQLIIGPPEVWERAKAALASWAQFDLDWVEPHDRQVPLETGRLFAFSSWQLGVWAVNVCRIVYTVDEPDRFGFGYGTLGRHVVRGEEAFLLERDAQHVRFRIRKFSMPAHPLVALVGPVAVRIQERFTVDALRRLRDEVVS